MITKNCSTSDHSPVSLFYLIHQLISGKLPSDHHDQVLNDILRAVHIQQTTNHHWQTTGIHLKTSATNYKSTVNTEALIK